MLLASASAVQMLQKESKEVSPLNEPEQIDEGSNAGAIIPAAEEVAKEQEELTEEVLEAGSEQEESVLESGSEQEESESGDFDSEEDNEQIIPSGGKQVGVPADIEGAPEAGSHQ